MQQPDRDKAAGVQPEPDVAYRAVRADADRGWRADQYADRQSMRQSVRHRHRLRLQLLLQFGDAIEYRYAATNSIFDFALRAVRMLTIRQYQYRVAYGEPRN